MTQDNCPKNPAAVDVALMRSGCAHLRHAGYLDEATAIETIIDDLRKGMNILHNMLTSKS